MHAIEYCYRSAAIEDVHPAAALLERYRADGDAECGRGLAVIEGLGNRSIAAGTDEQTIEANVTEILTAVPPEGGARRTTSAVAAEQRPPPLPLGDDFRRESVPPLRPSASFFP
jgi:hypothetical protein